jgi:hypothetical protein
MRENIALVAICFSEFLYFVQGTVLGGRLASTRRSNCMEVFLDDEEGGMMVRGLQLQLPVASTGHREYCKEDSSLAVVVFKFVGLELF